MITIHAEKYKIDLIWQCPECKECVTTNIDEVIKTGIPLCINYHYVNSHLVTKTPMEIVSYLISDTMDSIFSCLSK